MGPNREPGLRPLLAAAGCGVLSLVGIAQEFGAGLVVFLAGDLAGGMALLQELQGRLHLAVGDAGNWHQEGKERNPEIEPEEAPAGVHCPKIVQGKLLGASTPCVALPSNDGLQAGCWM